VFFSFHFDFTRLILQYFSILTMFICLSAIFFVILQQEKSKHK